MKNLIFAAIDIGSYNCRLTIVKKFKDNFKIIHNFSYGTNLISNLSFNNEFTEKNIEKSNHFMEENNDDFDFNQDIDYESEIKSPGWIRYQKRIKS